METDVRQLLERVKTGECSVDEAVLALKKAPFADLGYAKIDLHRKTRQGAAEVVYGAGKTVDQIADAPDSFLAVDDIEVGRGNRIPLWMFGLLY